VSRYHELGKQVGIRIAYVLVPDGQHHDAGGENAVAATINLIGIDSSRRTIVLTATI
jgi:hypothetical protein